MLELCCLSSVIMHRTLFMDGDVSQRAFASSYGPSIDVQTQAQRDDNNDTHQQKYNKVETTYDCNICELKRSSPMFQICKSITGRAAMDSLNTNMPFLAVGLLCLNVVANK